VTFETDLYAELSGVAGVVALVGDQIHPAHASEGATAPYIVYTPIFSEPFYGLDGESNMTRLRLQVDCYSEDVDEAAAMARAVIDAIPQSGALHRVAHNNQDLGIEDDTRLFRRLVEFTIFHRE
jgi:hypothetical protein